MMQVRTRSGLRAQWPLRALFDRCCGTHECLVL